MDQPKILRFVAFQKADVGLGRAMPALSHREILSMMEPVGTIWLNQHVRGLDIDISIHTDDERPAVYAWVVDNEIIYLGKAGKGLKRRMAQHRGGFRNSPRGKSHAEYLCGLTDRQKVVYLYAMWPEPVEVAGHKIPSHSSVEDWLIAMCEPTPVRNMAGI